MKFLRIGCLLLLLTAHQASSLKCNACTSTTSWENCKHTTTKCLPNRDQCIKVSLVAGGMKSFVKDCAAKAICTKADNPICKEGAGSVTCDVYCCGSDNCNAGSAFGASGFLLLACAAASLMILFK